MKWLLAGCAAMALSTGVASAVPCSQETAAATQPSGNAHQRCRPLTAEWWHRQAIMDVTAILLGMNRARGQSEIAD
jgi:hypothetical protein